MAEVVAVVGIIASVLGIIDGIDKSRTIFKKYVHSSASLRAELLPILGKLSAFAGILRGLQLQCELDEVNDDRLKALTHLKQPLKASEEAVKLISARLDQVVSLGRVSLAFGKVLDKETTAALHILDQARPVLDLALAADQRTIVKSIENYVRNVAQDLQDARLESKLHYDNITGQLHDIQAKQSDSAQAKLKADILAWISQTNYTTNYHAAREPAQHVDTSGDWFIAGKAFQDWTAGQGASRLLLHGISGSGKTVLCAKSIEHISRTSNATILYFFFDFNDREKETVEGMTRALLSQLLGASDAIPGDVQTFYDEHQASTSAKPSLRSWVDLLTRHLQSRQDVYVFVDALDECSESDLPFLKVSLAQLLAATDASVRWLLTSRPNIQTTNLLAGANFATVLMEPITVDKDIEMYLTAALKTDPRLSSFSNTASASIITEITAKSSGMFRYAHCQLETMAKLRDRRWTTVQKVLQTMPKTIAESYQMILFDAAGLDDWVVIQRILLLVSFSTRPVTVPEVSEFAILGITSDYSVGVNPDDRYDLSDALATISPLVTIRDGFVTLAHKSVHDFFAEASEPYQLFSTFQDADHSIAKMCLQYLRTPQRPVVDIPEMVTAKEPNTSQFKRLLEDYPFLDYAANHWSRHLQTKELQERLFDDLVATLPLVWEPNLWKAWLLLQRADIWENQIQLANVLSEALVHGAAVPGWSHNFWQQRQDYRIRSDVKEKATIRPLIEVQPKSINDEDSGTSMLVGWQSHFWVRAQVRHTASSGHFSPGQVPLPFDEGDLIFIKPRESSLGDKTWSGFTKGRLGCVWPEDVERCPSPDSRHISGGLYHEVAILLLEIAFQRPLCKEAMLVSNAISSINDLADYVAQLRHLTSQVVKKMGLQYGKIIDDCLSAIQWLDESSASKLDVSHDQEACMEKVCRPLTKIRTSGFRAARTPVRRQRIFQPAAYAPTTFVDGYVSSAATAPYRTATSVGYASYSAGRMGSAPPTVAGRAMSAEPRWASTSATFVSHSATYYSSPSPGTNYRPNSTSAAAVTYSASYTIDGPGSASATAPTGGRMAQSPGQAYLPPRAATSAPSHYGSPLAIMETVPENERVETIVESGGTSASITTNADSLLGGQEAQFSAASTGPTSEASGVMSAAIRGSDDLSSLQAIATETAGSPEELFASAFWNSKDSSSTEQILEVSQEIVAAHDVMVKEPVPESALGAGSEGDFFEIAMEHLLWDLTEGLSYNHLAGQTSKPTDVTTSDDERRARLDDARATVLNSDDAVTQLLWARDALEHVRVAEDNRSRTFRQSSRPVNVQYPEDGILNDALSIVTYLAEQDHPEAMYLLAKYQSSQLQDNALGHSRRLQMFLPLASMGHAGARYRAALAMQGAGDRTGRLEEYSQGDKPVLSVVNLKMTQLLAAAEHADSDAPDVLYTLGLIYANDWHLLDSTQESVPKNDTRAVGYLQRASFFGSGMAQARLAVAYEFGQLGLEASLSLALHYYVLAARRGIAEAEMGISKIMLYLVTGGGEPRDQLAHAAYAYAERAAYDEFPNALFAVGYYHEIGMHVVATATEAVRWYEKAAALGSADAVARLASLKPGKPVKSPSESTVRDSAATSGTHLEVGASGRPAGTNVLRLPHTAGGIPPGDHLPAELSDMEVEQIMAGIDPSKPAESAIGSTDNEKEVVGHPRRVQATATGEPISWLDEDVIEQLKALKWTETPWSKFYRPILPPRPEAEVDVPAAPSRPPPALPARSDRVGALAPPQRAAAALPPPPPPPSSPPPLPVLQPPPPPPLPPALPQPPPLPDRKPPARPPVAERIMGKWARQKDSIVGAPAGWRAVLGQKVGN